jgi:hypothetical protein
MVCTNMDQTLSKIPRITSAPEKGPILTFYLFPASGSAHVHRGRERVRRLDGGRVHGLAQRIQQNKEYVFQVFTLLNCQLMHMCVANV